MVLDVKTNVPGSELPSSSQPRNQYFIMCDLLLTQTAVGYRPLTEINVDKGESMAKFGKPIKHGDRPTCKGSFTLCEFF